MRSLLLSRLPASQQPAGRQPPGPPEGDYPSPLVVKNTFIDARIDRPPSLDGFWHERAVRSCPGSGIEAAESNEAEASPSKHAGLAESLVAGGTSTRSTSVGSVSPWSTLHGAADWSSRASFESPAAAASADPVPGLPEIEYPSPVLIKRTFIDVSPGRPHSLDGFYEERRLHSCPASGVFPVAEVEEAACEEEEKAVPSSGAPTPDEQEPPSPAAEAPPLPGTAQLPVTVSALPCVLLTLPSVGSQGHLVGSCSPCAHAHSNRGCVNGVQCRFCHLCAPGELKRRQKARRNAQRATESMGAAGRQPLASG